MREELNNKEKDLNQLNTINNPNMLNIKEENEISMNTPPKISGETIDKILRGCALRGWVGLRQLKCYLRNISAHKSDIMNKNDFKYFMAQQAILLNDEDINSIFAVYDVSKNDHINYIQFLNSINSVNDSRKAQIESFKEQVKVPGQNYILFSYLVSLIDMNYHPEAIRFLKTVPDMEYEYKINWDNLKEDNRIKENNFRQFFYDISACVDRDDDFNQILKALGYK